MYKTIIIPKDQIDILSQELEKTMEPSAMQGLYWLNIPLNLLNDMQKEHLSTCGPYVVSLEIEENKLIIEHLIRARQVLHCDCIQKATPEHKAFITENIDKLLLSLKIKPLQIIARS